MFVQSYEISATQDARKQSMDMITIAILTYCKKYWSLSTCSNSSCKQLKFCAASKKLNLNNVKPGLEVGKKCQYGTWSLLPSLLSLPHSISIPPVCVPLLFGRPFFFPQIQLQGLVSAVRAFPRGSGRQCEQAITFIFNVTRLCLDLILDDAWLNDNRRCEQCCRSVHSNDRCTQTSLLSQAA